MNRRAPRREMKPGNPVVIFQTANGWGVQEIEVRHYNDTTRQFNSRKELLRFLEEHTDVNKGYMTVQK